MLFCSMTVKLIIRQQVLIKKMSGADRYGNLSAAGQIV